MKKASPLLLTLLLACAPHALLGQSNCSSSTQGSTDGSSTQSCDPSTTSRSSSGSSYDPSENSSYDIDLYQRSSPNEIAPLTDTRQTQLPSATGRTDLSPYSNTRSNLSTSTNPPRGPVPTASRTVAPPTEFQNFVASSTGERLPIFGANLFGRAPSTFSPSDLNPISTDYVIGPDDELRVRIWGAASYSGNLRVDRSGSIYIPQVGAVQVAGLQFSQLDQRMRAAVAKTYRNFDLSVEMGRIRSIQVYLTGQVATPGAFNISSMSSLVDALYAGGGPSAQGSLRHVLLKRDGKVITDFDLYGLLLHGDKGGDVRLQSEDVLYVPTVGKQVALVGSVHTSAIFELRDHETLGDLLTATGGVSPLASKSNILVDRATEKGFRQAVDIAFDNAASAPLENGDIIRIQPAVPAYKNTVSLRGRVANAGRMAWHPGMRLSELIPDRDALLSRDYWWKRSHLLLPTAEFQTDVVPTKPLMRTLQRSVNSPSEEQKLQNSLDGANSASRASIAEEATRTSATQGEPETKVSVHLLDEDIDWSYAVIERINPDNLRTALIPFDLGKLVNDHDESQNLALEPGDIVTVFSIRDLRQPIDMQTKYVTIEGEVAHAGTYSVAPGETLTSVIARAGGITPKAYLFGSEFTRESARRFQQRRIDEYVQEVDLEVRRGALAVANAGLTGTTVQPNTITQERFLEQLRKLRASGRVVLGMNPSAGDVQSIPTIELENGDHFIVPSRPATINIVGAVYNPNVFLYRKTVQVKEYLESAGGPNRNADASKMFIIRADGSVENRSNNKGIFGDAFMHSSLNPGDTLIVPEKRLRPNIGLKTFMDYTQIFSQLAIGAASIAILGN